jgi:tetratricopeptide (TPR) repeat protein
MNRDAEAVEHYDRALGVAPDYIDALVNRGVALDKLGRHEEAIASRRRALALKADHTGALSNLGMALSNLNRHAEAITCYEQARRLEPQFTAAQYNLGNVLLLTGEFARCWSGRRGGWANSSCSPQCPTKRVRGSAA